MIPFVSRASEAEQHEWIQHLSAAMPEEQVVPFAQLTQEQKLNCDLAIVANPDPQDLLALPSLRWVHSVWAGVERILGELPLSPFSVVRLVDPQLAKTMSEAVLAWTLYLHRDMPQYAQQQAQKTWLQRPMVLAENRRIGLLGLGELGRVSAQLLVQNGFKVQGWSRQLRDIKGVVCFAGEEGLVQLLQQTDILICLLPLTAQTKGLLNKETLSILPAGASLINFARGAIIDDKALLSQLDQDALSHVVLDVFSQEPLPTDHPYWLHEKVTVLPHISAPTSPESASRIVANNVKSYRQTGSIPMAVDKTRGY